MQLEQMTIEQLADLRDKVNATLSERVSARQRELQTEMERVGSLVSGEVKKVKPKRQVKYRVVVGKVYWLFSHWRLLQARSGLRTISKLLSKQSPPKRALLSARSCD